MSNEKTIEIQSDLTFLNITLNFTKAIKERILQNRALDVVEAILEVSGAIQDRCGYDVSNARIDIVPDSAAGCVALIADREIPLLRILHEVINSPLDDAGQQRLITALTDLNDTLNTITVCDAYRTAGMLLAARATSYPTSH
jgi:hypothetical protein